MRSPNGQPAFYEYRIADPASAQYGAVDKPTFLWAGGWFLHVLYALAGVRENAWNLSFDPRLPASFDRVSYDLAVRGRTARVSWSGSGEHFRRILVDGAPSASAVLTGPAEHIALERGRPEAPYLASASALVDTAVWDPGGKVLRVRLRGAPGQEADLAVVTPLEFARVTLDGASAGEASTIAAGASGVSTLRVPFVVERSVVEVRIQFR